MPEVEEVEHSSNLNRRWEFRFGNVIAASIVLLISFRYSALRFILLCGIRPGRWARGYGTVMASILFVLFASPIDVGVPGAVSIFGNPRVGVRMVHVQRGMPMHTVLVARYGEYVSTGCTGLCPYEPTWYVVWW
jgi:hypothetical protein